MIRYRFCFSSNHAVTGAGAVFEINHAMRSVQLKLTTHTAMYALICKKTPPISGEFNFGIP